MFLLLAVRDMQSMWANEITEFDMMSTMDESCDDDDDDGKKIQTNLRNDWKNRKSLKAFHFMC